MATPPAVSEDPYIGRVLAHRYRIDRILQVGGMGTVYEGENLAIGRRVAIKVLHPYFAQSDECQERFEREARAAAYIGHPSIIDVLDLGRTETGVPYMVMALLEGETLYAWLSRRGALAIRDAVRIVIEVARALRAAHRAGIVHRDLKPENVFVLLRDGEIQGIKILDFGIAKFRSHVDTRITADGIVIGTPAYMSPEQALGRESDSRADIYSAGVLLYELVSGRLPYLGDISSILNSVVAVDAPRLDEVAPWAPTALADIVARAMARDPEHRFQSADEMLVALEGILGTIDPDAGTRPQARWHASSPGLRGTAIGLGGVAASAAMDSADVPAPPPSGTPPASIVREAQQPFGRRWWLGFSVAVTLMFHLGSTVPLGTETAAAMTATPVSASPVPVELASAPHCVPEAAAVDPTVRALVAAPVTDTPVADVPALEVAANDTVISPPRIERRVLRTLSRTRPSRRLALGTDASADRPAALEDPPSTRRTLPFEAVY